MNWEKNLLKRWKRKQNAVPPPGADAPGRQLRPAAPQVTGRRTQKADEICAAASTDIGRRRYQQDCYRIPSGTPDSAFLCVLCDGMGGMENGEKASQTAADLLADAFAQAEKMPQEPFDFLEKNIYEADRRVSHLTDANGNPLQSGSTLLAALADGDKLYWASVGDSRIYLLHDGQLQQLTRDQNYGEVLLQQLRIGQITIDEANADPQKDALTHFIGIGDLNSINMPNEPLHLEADDIVLMCSDGLYRTLEEDEICTILRENKTNLPFAAWALVQAAIGKNLPYQDNTTVVLLRANAPKAAADPKPAPGTERPTPNEPAKTLHLPERPAAAPAKTPEAGQPPKPPTNSNAVPSKSTAPDEKQEAASKTQPQAAEPPKEPAQNANAAAPQARPKPNGPAVTELIR